MSEENTIASIQRLKREMKAIVLAHYYQDASIQSVADFVGDSYGLSIEASKTEADVVVFAGVHFMAETAKILNPDKVVLLPDVNAGCSLASSCGLTDFLNMRKLYPDHYAVTYINCSAEIKAASDVVCTSANALKIISSIPADRDILFAPDKNLGRYLQRETGREMLLWDGECAVHTAFSSDKLDALCGSYPDAVIVAHPESEEWILKRAEFIGSTAALVNYVRRCPFETIIVATEVGVLDIMREESPEKHFIPAPVMQDNACACSDCGYMKMNTLEKLYHCMLNRSPEIIVPDAILRAARVPLIRMMELSS